MSAMKRCNRCGVEKLLEQFSRHKKCTDGYQGTCLECTAEITANWTRTHSEQKKVINARYEATHPKRKAISRNKRRQIEPKRIEAEEREKNLMSRYGIDLWDYANLFNAQNGKCKLCKRLYSDFARGLVVDHNHKTGKIRGLLCDPCNRALGYFGDSVETMSLAISYINQNP